jgi:hypothetical protein
VLGCANAYAPCLACVCVSLSPFLQGEGSLATGSWDLSFSFSTSPTNAAATTAAGAGLVAQPGGHSHGLLASPTAQTPAADAANWTPEPGSGKQRPGSVYMGPSRCTSFACYGPAGVSLPSGMPSALVEVLSTPPNAVDSAKWMERRRSLESSGVQHRALHALKQGGRKRL